MIEYMITRNFTPNEVKLVSTIKQIIGSRFTRDPPDSTLRYTKWANELDESKLTLQVYTSHGPTVIMPTWFCHRAVFDR